MKYLYKILYCVLFLVAMAPPLWAKDINTVAVLPFSAHSAENIDYIRLGITDMLASRISANVKIQVVGKDAVMAAMKEMAAKELTAADIPVLGQKLNADFVVWGSITKIGASLSIDGKLTDIAANKSALGISVLCPTMDEVIPKITDFAQQIASHITGAVPAVISAPAASQKEIIVSRPPIRQTTPYPATREAEIISGMRTGQKGTYTAAINQDFINAAQPMDSKSFWKSQQFAFELRGVDIGDVNGDGLNETVMIDTNNVYIYQKKDKQGEFKLIQKIPGNRYSSYIAVDVADINRNGIKEIIVSSITGPLVNSLVIEFRDGKFETLAQDIRWFMRVIEDSSGSPILMGQRRGMESAFNTPIHEVVWQNGVYREGPKMKIPEGLSIYGLTLAKLGTGKKDVVITLNEDDYLCIYEQTDKPLSKVAIFGGSEEFLWKNDEVFGGSNTFIDPIAYTSMVQGENTAKPRYINSRILTYDTNKDGKKEIIVVRNTSSSGRMFQSVKLFTAAEIYNLEWDGMGMVENWRTKKIAGYVSDYQFKDIDNDGENEVVMALGLTGGGVLKDRSVIISYDLKKE